MRVLSLPRALLIAVAVAVAIALAPAAVYPLDVDVGLFHDELSPYGTWYESPQYGSVFAPRVDSGWRPYTVGQWVWTDDYGWLWASEEDFGWATFHYGRWYQDPALGWAWVPGNEWGPSWVSYRYGGDYIGWAPLPPRAAWSPGVGLQTGSGGIDALIQPSYYTFVPARAFVNTGIQRYAVPVSQNRTIINVTRNVTNYSARQGRVVNRSVSVDQVEKLAGQRVRRARLVEVDSVKVARKARLKDDEIQVFKPTIRAARAKAPARGKPLPTTTAAREVPREREADQQAVSRRADEAKRKASIDKKREAEAAQRRADEAKRQAEARQQEERRAEQKRQADARRELERENQARQREQLEQRQAQPRKEVKEPARQQSEQRKVVVSREKRATPQAEKKKEKPKKPDDEKPPKDKQ